MRYESMDPLSITGTALALVSTIGQVVVSVDRFTRQVRDARTEMDEVSRELGSLKSAIQMLKEDLETPGVDAPNGLHEIFKNCKQVIQRLDATLQEYNRDRLSSRARYVWKGKDTINGYRRTLADHNLALNLALQIMGLTLTRVIQTDVRELRDSTNDLKTGVDQIHNSTDEIKEDTERILDEIAILQARLPGAFRTPVPNRLVDENANYMLRKYLDGLTEYAESVVGGGDLDQRSNASGAQADDESVIHHNVPRSQVARAGSHRRPWTSSSMNEPPTLVTRSIGSIAAPPRTAVNLEDLKSNISMGLRFAKTGLETLKHKEWRHDVELAIREVPDGKIGPKNGQSYQCGVDYTLERYGYQDRLTGIKPACSSMGTDIKCRALMIKWIRHFSMDGNCINYSVYCGDSANGSGKLWISPLMVAIEMQDNVWTNHLLAANAVPSDEFTYRLGPSRAESYLALLLDWNLAIFKRLLNRIVCRRPSSLGRLREDALKHVSRKPLQEEPLAIMAAETDRGHSLSSQDLDAWRLQAAELLLSNGPRMETHALEPFLQAAVEARANGMVELLVRYDADVNHISPRGYGTILHYAIQWEIWDMTRFLLDTGANPNIKAELTRYWLNSFRESLTPIEFAGYKGQLKKLNEALGTQYKDTRSATSKMASKINRYL